jgi:ankyrin repeat protein
MKRTSLLFVLPVLLLSLLSISGCKPNPETMRASLMAAVKADNTADVKKLLAKGANANSRTSPTGWSALHYAARNGNVEEVQALLNAGADPSYSGTMEGQTGSVVSVQPLAIARATMDLVSQIPAANMEQTLHQIGLNDPALLKSLKDPSANSRYQKVVEILTGITKEQ